MGDLTGVLMGVLIDGGFAEVLTGVLTEVWPEGVDGCCGGGSDGCFDGIFDGGFDSGSFFTQWAQPCQNASFWQVPPMGHNLAKTALWGRFRPGRTAAKPSVKTSVKTLKTPSGLKLIVPCQ